jgi:hypothetical protein
MFKEKDIQGKIAETVAVIKKSDKKIPEFNPIYKPSIEYLERVSVHSEIGKFPEKLFSDRSPNQTEEERKYIRNNYKTVSFPVWARLMSFLNRIWNDANWSIEYADYERFDEDSPQKYLEEEYPVYGSLEDYFKQIVTATKEKDPNAVIVVKPYKIPMKEKNGEVYIDETQKIKPVCKIYGCEKVVSFEEEYALLISEEKSWVEYGNTKIKDGLVFEFYDENNYWKIIQVGKKTDYQFDYILVWAHNLGYLPARKLKAEPKEVEGKVLYQSRFMAAIEPLDLMLLDASNLQVSKNKHVYQHFWEIAPECDYSNEYGHCVDGKIMYDGHNVNCPSCKGTGKKTNKSPLGVYQIKEHSGLDGGSQMPMPPFGFVAPDPVALEFLREEIERHKEEALSILNLTSPSHAKGGDVALTRQIDREESFSLLLAISNELFDLYEFMTKCIIEMRYGKIELPVISYPRTFAIRNELDLTEEIKQAKDGGLPDIVIRSLMIEYLKTRFNYQEDVAKMVDVAFSVDRLITLSGQEVGQKKLSGTVSGWEDILHTSVYSFIEDAVYENENFFELDRDSQKEILISKAKSKASEVEPQRITPDSILANLGA